MWIRMAGRCCAMFRGCCRRAETLAAQQQWQAAAGLAANLVSRACGPAYARVPGGDFFKDGRQVRQTKNAIDTITLIKI